MSYASPSVFLLQFGVTCVPRSTHLRFAAGRGWGGLGCEQLRCQRVAFLFLEISRAMHGARTVARHTPSRAGYMRTRHLVCILLLLLLFLHCCLSISPPKNRPPRSNAAEAQPQAHHDPSIIVPLYKEALKADAEGRPEESLRLLSIPPLSLSPGILATCPPPPPPPPSPHPFSHSARASCNCHGACNFNSLFCSIIRLHMKLRRWGEAEQLIRDAPPPNRDAMSMSCAPPPPPTYTSRCTLPSRSFPPYILMLFRYLAFLLARRCEFDASAQLLLQLWEQGGGSDLTSDRITHFLILALDSGRARSWSRSSDEAEGRASDVHDCTVGVAACHDISPPLPSPAACRRNWREYTGGASSLAVASTAAAARKMLAEVPLAAQLPPSLLIHAAVAAAAARAVGQRQQQQVVLPQPPPPDPLMALQGWACIDHRHCSQLSLFFLSGQHGLHRRRRRRRRRRHPLTLTRRSDRCTRTSPTSTS